MHAVLRSSGRPLDAQTRAYMEPRFNRDFSRVRVHTGADAAASARLVGALAYTVGQQIVFGDGQFAPRTRAGRRLLAHELAHAVQQQAQGWMVAPRLEVGAADTVAELEAERAAERVASGHRAPVIGAAPSPIIQRVPGSQAPAAPTCDVAEPQNCDSYEAWIGLFQALPTFQARSGHAVIGPQRGRHGSGGPPAQATAESPTANPSERRPFVLHERQAYLPYDRFIDGPTDQWVRAHLPPELVATAYQLPSDCADIAVILRHVWLVAHRRTENYRGWVVGAALDDPRTREMRGLIRGSVASWTVPRIVQPYTGPDGQPILDFRRLQNLLHAGDILVWDHPAPATGHTQTITSIHREQGRVVQIQALQGNEPIGEAAARDILIQHYGFREGQLPPGQQRRWPRRARTLERELRHAPGRRIEVSNVPFPHDGETNIWTWADGTRLVAAGPPVGGMRPRTRAGRTGPHVVRGLPDWERELQRARDIRVLENLVEAALLETRSLLEGGHGGIVSIADAERFGRIAGERLWALANRTARARMAAAARRSHRAPIRDQDLYGEDLGEESHYRPLRHIRGLMQRLGADAHERSVAHLFAAARQTFLLAARGISSVAFHRSGAERRHAHVAAHAQLSQVLLTGFDPFQFQRNRQIEPQAGRFNPSGAAILQLDGRTIPVSRTRAAAVEGVVLPVDYDQFHSGIIESQLGSQLNSADAVITVSEDPNLGPQQPVRVERFAVGVHRLNNGRLERIPAPPGSSSLGPAVVETGSHVDLPAVVHEAGAALPADQDPTLGQEIRFRFADAATADRALSALGLPTQARAVVGIQDVAAIRAIANTMRSEARGPGISFEAAHQTFHTLLLRGPGGSFLSNEVSYRVLRFLAGHNPSATSFHVHTPGSPDIPQDVTGREAARQQALRAGRQRPTTTELSSARGTARRSRFAAIEIGRGVVRRVVTALVELIKAVVRRLP